MPEQWNFDLENQRIGSRIRDLETRLHEIQTYKLQTKESYKKEHDEIIGALYVNYALVNHVDLLGRSSCLRLLRSMLDQEPPPDRDSFDDDIVKNGWRSEIRWKLNFLEGEAVQ